MKKRLYVFFNNKIVGFLNSNKEREYEFQYEGYWLTDKDNFSICPSMPLQQDPFSSRLTKSFFENLIPEGDILEKIRQYSSSPIESEYDFLERYGLDCAGALSVSVDPNYVKNYNTDAKKEISLNNIYKALKKKKSLIQYLLEEDESFFSLAGAQDKIPIIYTNNKLFIPLKGGATTHIIKSPARIWDNTQDSVYNEYFCMRLAKHVGLPTSNCDLIEGEVPLYITERYDRMLLNGQTQRIHQVDFCQGQGFLSNEKYEVLGGPSFKSNYEFLKGLPATNVNDLQNLLNWFFFNFFIGNHDNHCKNISLLLINKNWILAPYYDLLSTSIYPQIRRKLAFKIGGQSEWKKINNKQLNQMDLELKLRKGTCHSIALKLKNKLENSLHQLLLTEQDRFPKVDTFKKIEKVIIERIKLFTNDSKSS